VQRKEEGRVMNHKAIRWARHLALRGLVAGHGLATPAAGWTYSSVHRWDKEVDAFKKVDDATRDAVLAFYYDHIGHRCERPFKPRN
jgi:hypothetical protein